MTWDGRIMLCLCDAKTWHHLRFAGHRQSMMIENRLKCGNDCFPSNSVLFRGVAVYFNANKYRLKRFQIFVVCRIPFNSTFSICCFVASCVCVYVSTEFQLNVFRCSCIDLYSTFVLSHLFYRLQTASKHTQLLFRTCHNDKITINKYRRNRLMWW